MSGFGNETLRTGFTLNSFNVLHFYNKEAFLCLTFGSARLLRLPILFFVCSKVESELHRERVKTATGFKP